MQLTAEELAAIIRASALPPPPSPDPTTSSKLPSFIDGGDRKVIVRSRDAGCLYGKLRGYTSDGAIVHLRDARQMWSWTAAKGGTLVNCAIHGASAGKFSDAVSAMTVIGACAIIDVTDEAAKTLESRSW